VSNFVDSVYGTVTKTVDPVTGSIVWTLPCDLGAGLESNPRLAGEALFCYFLRLFQDGIAGAQGPQGEQGPPGPAGLAAYASVTTEFVAPTLGAPLFSFTVDNPAWIAEQMILFISELGWVRVESKTGSMVLATLIQLVDAPVDPVPVGAGVAPTGPAGSAGPEPDVVATPLFSPAAGTYTGTQNVTIVTATASATIYYTTDGSPPTVASTVYSTPVPITEDTTLKAFAVRSGFIDSSIASGVYNIRVAAPVPAPAAGNYLTTQSITLTSSTSGASIRYTLDGSTPTESVGTLYVGAFDISANTTLKAIAYKTGMTNSLVTTAVYTFDEAVDGFWGSSEDPDLGEASWDSDLTAWSQSLTDYLTTQELYAYPAVPTAAGPYRYYIVMDSAAAAAAVGGFNQSGFNLAPEDFAGAGEGYSDVDANGWPCKIETHDSVDYRKYRLLNELNGGFNLRVQQY